jgi:hypothetical protein
MKRLAILLPFPLILGSETCVHFVQQNISFSFKPTSDKQDFKGFFVSLHVKYASLASKSFDINSYAKLIS